jgi:hypothetical protein
VRADVQVRRVGVIVDKVGTGARTASRVLGEIDWGFALRPVENDEYLFSYSAKSNGHYAMATVREVDHTMASTFEAALGDLLESMTHDNVPQTLVALRK